MVCLMTGGQVEFLGINVVDVATSTTVFHSTDANFAHFTNLHGYQTTSYRVGRCPTLVGHKMLKPLAAPLATAELSLRCPKPPE